ncbi:major facilitator superfamily domain-containing protein [Achaetomium macrosporum]|uniref:Major facilitator superfamily domain-containing protein n=1 Tax=Achaetomium macrosporum TaxID=79813 RepID=A0AAN7C1L6_9PEZI|nr:major facilitator superfamily domain-containing protein [Achaetomium macrosporum]
MATTDHIRQTRISGLMMLAIRDIVTPQMLEHDYEGSGTPEDPYIVMFLEDDPPDPMAFSVWVRWLLCLAAGYVTFSVAFISSAFSGSIRDVYQDLGASPESATLGLSLFLLGFVLSPLLWAPSSEHFGRQIILLCTSTIHVALNIAACFSPTLAILLVLRLLSGAFGAATLTNSGAVIADIFHPRQRGLAITVYALVPLFAPVLGPMVGTYVSGVWGWRWSMAVMALLSMTALAVAALVLPETYAPFLLDRRARRLTKMTGHRYVSSMAATGGTKGGQRPSLVTTLSRPFLLAANEPIISLLALYQAVVFGTLYFMFAALPLVYTDMLGWTREQSGLSLLGFVVGMALSVVFAICDNARYGRALERLNGEVAPPETRLAACCLGSPGSSTWPRVCPSASASSWSQSAPPTMYLVDVYTIYAASALTVCICGRAIWGAVFPLFVRSMFASIGVMWSLAIPAVLSLICLPFPFVFYRFGPAIPARCRYAGEAHMAAQRARQRVDEDTPLLA